MKGQSSYGDVQDAPRYSRSVSSPRLPSLFLALKGTIIVPIFELPSQGNSPGCENDRQMRGTRKEKESNIVDINRYFYQICSMLSLNPLPWRSSSKCHPRHFFRSQKSKNESKDISMMVINNYQQLKTIYCRRIELIILIFLVLVNNYRYYQKFLLFSFFHELTE